MNNHWGLLAVGLTIIAFGSALMLVLIPAPKTPIDTPVAPFADLIVVDVPKPNDGISATAAVFSGKARGTWYFEASFPIDIKNASGTVIAQGHAEAQGDWMTEDFVPFTATVTYPAQPKGSKGTVVFKNDNPSGDPARDKAVEVPIVF